MTRYRHVAARNAAAILRGGGPAVPHAGRVDPTRRPVEPIPVGPNLEACPVCGGGVRRVKATFNDTEMGIRRGVTKLLANHSAGGYRVSTRQLRCGGAEQVARNQT